MQLGMIGLGRMGANMVRRLIRGGHHCVVFDVNPKNVQRLVGEGAIGANSMDDLISRLSPPRAVWVMVPAGEATETTVESLVQRLSPKDIIIDGGNSYFKDDVRRARALTTRGLHYVDVGTSGGTWGLDRGYCLMIGGPGPVVKHFDPIFKTLAPGRGDPDDIPLPRRCFRQCAINSAATSSGRPGNTLDEGAHVVAWSPGLSLPVCRLGMQGWVVMAPSERRSFAWARG